MKILRKIALNWSIWIKDKWLFKALLVLLIFSFHRVPTLLPCQILFYKSCDTFLSGISDNRAPPNPRLHGCSLLAGIYSFWTGQIFVQNNLAVKCFYTQELTHFSASCLSQSNMPIFEHFPLCGVSWHSILFIVKSKYKVLTSPWIE